MSSLRNTLHADVVVIGAGIIGASCAYFLAHDGHRVVLVDRGSVASGTSGAGEGNILLSDKAPGPELELTKLGCALWERLAAELPDDFEYERKGALLVAENELQLNGLRTHAAAMRGAGVQVELLVRPELRDLEPHLAHDIAGASFFPGDAQVQPMLACAALVRAAKKAGATFLDHTDVMAIERAHAGDTWTVRTTNSAICARCAVDAAGPWSASVARMAGIDVPVAPRKGHIVVTEPLPRLVRHKVMESGYAAAVNSDDASPKVAAVVEGTKSGTILLGSSRQLVGFDSAIEVDVVRAVVRRALRFFPVLSVARAIRTYVGFRPFTPDHLPLIGETGAPDFYVNAGHEGAGIGLGPISGLLLGRMIAGVAPDIDMGPFSPARFNKIGAAMAQR